jgi:type II restriction enzyme
LSSKLIEQKGTLIAALGDISIGVTSKDVMGGVIQDWLFTWMKKSGFRVKQNPNTQMPPDFFVSNDIPFEVKAFYHLAKPAFDLANFSAYTRDLLHHPVRLDDDHLIFAYDIGEDYWSIKNIYLKKIWEMSGSSPKNHIELQAKQGIATNLRPKNFCSSRAKLFTSRGQFVSGIALAMDKFHQYPEGFSDSNTWLAEVQAKYQETTGFAL